MLICYNLNTVFKMSLVKKMFDILKSYFIDDENKNNKDSVFDGQL